MIHLFGMASPNVVKVIIMLEELEIPWRFSFVNVHAGEQFSEAFRELNPNSKTPVIVDEGDPGAPVTVFESGAILIYLAERHKALLPEDSPARPSVLQWLMFQMANFGPTSGQAVHFHYVTDYFKFLEHPDEYARSRFRNELARLIGVVERRLGESAFMGGPVYTIADIALYPWVRSLGGYFPELIERPHIARWRENVAARPAVTRALSFLEDVTAQAHRARRGATPQELARYFGRIADAPGAACR
jgi:GST-like protein